MAKIVKFMYNKIGDTMNTYIEKTDDFGRGIAYIDNKITFIPNSLENELIEYRLVKEKSKYNIAEIVKIINKNEKRIKPVCPYYLKCGGCQLEHMDFSYENNFKIQKVKNILKKFAKIEIDNLEIVSKNDYNYRNKITLTVKGGKLGLLEEKSNKLIEIDKCYLVNDKINKVIKELRKYIINEPNIEKIMIRTGNKTDDVMLYIKGSLKNIKDFASLCNSLIINDEIITNSYITSYIGDKKFHIRYDSFFQVNDEMVTYLYEEVKKIIKNLNSKNVLDLYCGVGTIGIYISSLVESVLGVEVIESAIISANENKKINNIKNISFINNKVENTIYDIDDKFDTVILDPPRTGLDKYTREFLLNRKIKNIIYISCDPITFSRDIFELNKKYDIKHLKLFNMFSRTYHVECVCLLIKKTY